MKLAFKKVGEGGNEEGDREIEDLADEDSEEGEEGDMEVDEKKEDAEEVSKPGLLRRARNKMIGTTMTNSEACPTISHTLDLSSISRFLFPYFLLSYLRYFSVSIL